jgi:FixJ family two-component response regulator
VLTVREHQILELSFEGRDPGTIAALLRLPREWVEEYRSRAAVKIAARENFARPFRICEVLATR